MVVNVTKIYPKMKNKSLLSIEKKNITEREKTLYYHHKEAMFSKLKYFFMIIISNFYNFFFGGALSFLGI